MTEFSWSARSVRRHAGPVTRVRNVVRSLVVGRQTRADVRAAVLFLAVALATGLVNAFLATDALLTRGACSGADCGFGSSFDIYGLAFIVSLLAGSTFAVHALINLLSRRRAWGYALLAAVASIGCLVGAVAVTSW